MKRTIQKGGNPSFGSRPGLMIQKVARWTSDPQALASSLLSAGGGLIAAATGGRLSGYAASAGGSLAGSLVGAQSGGDLASAGLSEGRDGEGEEGGAQPEFLPMVPWYSGTSADILKTALDLAITLKLFVGRFDMRTMQVCE